MSRTTRSLATYSYGNGRTAKLKFNRRDDYIPKGFSRNKKVQGWYSNGGWPSSNHIRGILRKFVGKHFDEFYSYFCKLYNNTKWFDDKKDLVPIYYPIEVGGYKIPIVRCVREIRFGKPVFNSEKYYYLGKDVEIPSEVMYVNNYWYRNELQSLESIALDYRGAFYLDFDGIIHYIKSSKFNSEYRRHYISDLKAYLLCKVESTEDVDVTTRWDKYVASCSTRPLSVVKVQPREKVFTGRTKVVLAWDIDEDGNLFSYNEEMPVFKRIKEYRYAREYTTRAEKKKQQSLKKKNNETVRD